MVRNLLVTTTAAALVAVATAQTPSQTFNLGNIVVSGETVVPLNLGGVPFAPPYVAYRVTTDWSVAGGDPFSSEASVFFGDPSTFTIISDIADGYNAAGDGLPVPGLGFTGAFTPELTGFPAIDFVANAGGFGDANFDNTVVEWFVESDLSLPAVGAPAAVQPTAVDLGVLGDESASFSINTFGTAFDTELGLYGQDGALIANNDDAAGVLQSEVSTGGVSFDDMGGIFSGIAAGEYFIAVGRFNTVFNPGFDVVGDEEAGGVYTLNAGATTVTGDLLADTIDWYKFTITPEPTSLVLLALGGMFIRRR